ncbi:alcohol dehydrogenase-like regulatory protein ErcA [Methanoregula sp.]|uniref:alcohol dehydrogenase-like regulatory protein ErcA n=1 Tax=Methanoregula sp. TaxID=2052170 RepID=UPI00236E2F1B|nr:alcohol dehydrogenase-like regulatory protein ErcA [Methanoregula sp.]MDD1685883.1 iron-containing alcohol dehydrogenase [Methanoregula sp.]
MNRDNLELRKFVAPEFIIGADARLLAGRYAKNFSSQHVLVVTDPNIARNSWFSDVTGSLGDAGIASTIFSSVTPNPRDTEVMEGANIYAEAACDAIVAIGGGSAIDCAKGIGIVSSNGKHISDYEGVDRITVPSPPLICIPTTAGTGAEVSQFAIINNTDRNVKITIISKKIVPDIALIDPLPLTTLTPELTAHTGMDALTHSVEAYVSNASSPVTDIHAIESIRLIQSSLLSAYRTPKNIELRYQTMLGSLCAGLAFSNASLGAVHAMAHSLGGFSDLPHGECNALLLEHVMAFNFPACPGRYEAIGQALGTDLSALGHTEKKEKIIDGIRTLRETLGITDSLGNLGVTREDIPTLAQNALRDPCMATNPRQPSQKDIERIYEEAL